MNKSVSVIIPTFNRKELIRYTLDSLAEQYHPGVAIEVIVVDDGSTDGTREVIQTKYPTIKFLNNTGKGASAARNTGLKEAQGKYVMYLDSDDLAGPGYFQEKIEFLEENASIDAVYGDYDNFNTDGEFDPAKIVFRHKYPLITTPERSKEHLVNYLGENYLPQNSIVWRRGFLQKINGHDATLVINQDVELVMRAVFAGLRMVYVQDGTKVYVRDHAIGDRVGTAFNAGKFRAILDLRKRIYQELMTHGYTDRAYMEALSRYLFYYWRMLRHKDPAIATDFLALARQVYWPLEVRGNILIRTLSKLIGPVNTVNLKYGLLKRD